MKSTLIIAAVSYLLGSIPFGYLLVRIFRGEDVRKSGSGNIGATNVSRKSPALGVLTLLLDGLKGSAAVVVASILGGTSFGLGNTTLMASPAERLTWASLAAFFAVLGHLFPVWLKFHGGKGVATGLGSFALIAPKAVLVAVGIFVVLVLFFRYVSLGSITAVALFPTLTWAFHEFGGAWLALLFITLASVAIVLKHHANIGRLLAGTEHRIGAKPAINQGKQ